MNLNRLAYFAAVLDTGSFTQAAERLGVTKAVVSQQVARLEEELGASLIVRSTRRVQPTEAGRAFHARCILILKEAEDAFDLVAEATGAPTGTLRLTAPYDYGTAKVVPAVTRYIARHPGCEVDVSFTDRRLDLMAGELDLAIHVGWLQDSSLQARRIGDFRQVLVATPAVVSAFGVPQRPADLVRLPFVANLALRDPLTWRFSRDAVTRETVQLSTRLRLDTTTAVYNAVRLDAGLSVLPDFLVAGDLADGRLVCLLPDWQLASGGIHAVFPPARYRPPKVTAFVDILRELEAG
ncbi:LysR family transcriptional regulator [Microvirga tunisiensis]|uniref:LysR family transcriptional regulator n=3 Tax=Pannonibacter tanglangensis TaxID=2750084 RepID=A0A7X5J9B0_9HYPH|nr:LysR family transcriptional regulator [Pannonibacter sp. XCT-34]NBN78717.1 LysR family transcriptional regulator [Pannonibacter sp. XCT-53]